MSAWWFAAQIWALSAVVMAGVWAFSMRVRNFGYVDVAGAGLMALSALLAGLLADGATLPRTVTVLAGSIWAARLCLYLLHRVMHDDEDGRYAALRERWNGSPARFFVFFQAQAIVVALFALPLFAAASNPVSGVTAWTIAAIVVWVTAVGGEALADAQLSEHRAERSNRGKTCRSGFWAWSRHPNYFFEWLHWFTYVLLAVGSADAWLAWLGPVAMLAFLYRITGIPWTEKNALRSRGEDYARYQREVSAFLPWPPKRGQNPELPMSLINLAERGLLPDAAIRAGIRRLCAQRLRDEHAQDIERADARSRKLLLQLRGSPIAIETDAANAQHYEVPSRLFELCLGKRLKYSSCYYPTGKETLDQAEDAMLSLYGERAGLADGQNILELGCGWGSLTLWMAERFPNATITGLSNSNGQRQHIMAQANARGLRNIDILTRDVNTLTLEGRYDRVVSIEMFEHVRNHATLLQLVAGWLEDDGKLFVHIFCHRTLLYPFEDAGQDDWMARHFFTGGLMPAADTLLHLQRDLRLEQRWLLSGTHYQRSANHWLQNQDANRDAVLEVLTAIYGSGHAQRWAQRWRIFWTSCAELFGYRSGNEWGVAHYRFGK